LICLEPSWPREESRGLSAAGARPFAVTVLVHDILALADYSVKLDQLGAMEIMKSVS